MKLVWSASLRKKRSRGFRLGKKEKKKRKRVAAISIGPQSALLEGKIVSRIVIPCHVWGKESRKDRKEGSRARKKKKRLRFVFSLKKWVRKKKRRGEKKKTSKQKLGRKKHEEKRDKATPKGKKKRNGRAFR